MTATVWILGDQLLLEHPALQYAISSVPQKDVSVLFVESGARLRRQSYHRLKLVLLLSAMRHYAGVLREMGLQVDYRRAKDTLSGLRAHIRETQSEMLVVMAASEQRGRNFQNGLQVQIGIPVKILPNTQFLVGEYDPLPDAEPHVRYTQESFYREMRRHFKLLLDEDGEPLGGQWNYDRQNRERLPRDFQPPAPISFLADRVTQQVIVEVNQMEHCVGEAHDFGYGVTHEQALEALEDFVRNRLDKFGNYQDAMRKSEEVLYHSLISPYLNIGLLEPLQVVRRVERAYHDGMAPLNSVEGFIRQVVGWREYMYWQYWRYGQVLEQVNFWSAQRELPEFFWDGDTPLNCLGDVIRRVLKTGYAHHIERLMILSNFCLLAGIFPKEVNRWFLSVFVDAYEWVMLPNVYGMGLYADGGLISTKPYVASANYINRMSDYCKTCAYNKDLRTGSEACPFNYLYWNFMIVHQDLLRKNPRMRRSLIGMNRFDSTEKQDIVTHANAFLKGLRGAMGSAT